MRNFSSALRRRSRVSEMRDPGRADGTLSWPPKRCRGNVNAGRLTGFGARHNVWTKRSFGSIANQRGAESWVPPDTRGGSPAAFKNAAQFVCSGTCRESRSWSCFRPQNCGAVSRCSVRPDRDYHDFTISSVFRATDQSPARSALLTANWRGCEVRPGKAENHPCPLLRHEHVILKEKKSSP